MTFPTTSAYLDHCRIHQSANFVAKEDLSFKFNSDECEYKSDYPGNMDKHFLINRKHVAKFSCTFCEYKTNRCYDLKKHLIIHTQERPFVCSVCNRGFKRKTHLQSHMINVHNK